MPQDSITAITHIGLDVHARTIAVALAEQAGLGEVDAWGEIANTPQAVAELVKRLARPGRRLWFWYEAGPCGYGLWRQLMAMGHGCAVVAPSLIPRKSGDRVKTDRRDAMSLARLGRAGELTGVWVPEAEHEAMRDLTRCREDAKNMQRAARQQLSGFLLRQGRHYTKGQTWTNRHHLWLTSQRFESTVHETVYQDYLNQVDQLTQRVERLDASIAQAVGQWSLEPVLKGLMAMRGVDLLVGATALAELGDLTRFDSPPQLMAFLGLVPSEHSSGMSQRRGGITKAGNSHARRMLVEAAWSYRFPARKTKHIQARAKKAPESVQEIAWQAQRRLCGRYQHLTRQANKPSVVACTAVAREMSGFMWAIARETKRLNQAKQLESGGTSSGTLDSALRRPRTDSRRPAG